MSEIWKKFLSMSGLSRQCSGPSAVSCVWPMGSMAPAVKAAASRGWSQPAPNRSSRPHFRPVSPLTPTLPLTVCLFAKINIGRAILSLPRQDRKSKQVLLQRRSTGTVPASWLPMYRPTTWLVPPNRPKPRLRGFHRAAWYPASICDRKWFALLYCDTQSYITLRLPFRTRHLIKMF